MKIFKKKTEERSSDEYASLRLRKAKSNGK